MIQNFDGLPLAPLIPATAPSAWKVIAVGGGRRNNNRETYAEGDDGAPEQ